jgi:hypothetical protein
MLVWQNIPTTTRLIAFPFLPVASCNGDLPSEFFASTSAPYLRRIRAISCNRRREARCRGVSWSLFCAFTSAPLSSSLCARRMNFALMSLSIPLTHTETLVVVISQCHLVQWSVTPDVCCINLCPVAKQHLCDAELTDSSMPNVTGFSHPYLVHAWPTRDPTKALPNGLQLSICNLDFVILGAMHFGHEYSLR